MSRLCCIVAAVLVALLAAPAGGVEVRLTVRDDAGAERAPGLVTAGVPFAKGAVKDLGKLSVSVGGKKLPAQFERLASWEDGSVRWVLMDCQVPVAAGGKTELALRDDGGNPAPPQRVQVDNGDSEVVVSTGPMRLVLDKTSGAVFKSIKVDGKELIDSTGRGLVIWADCPSLGTVRCSGRPSVDCPKFGPGKPIVAGPPSQVKVEAAGPMRAVVVLRGTFPKNVHKGLAAYTVRVYAWAGAKRLKIHAWLENNGAHGYSWEKGPKKVEREWMVFDGLALELGLGLGGAIKAECEGAGASGTFRVYQGVKTPSGDRGPAYRLEDLVYRITSGSRELTKGVRTDGVVSLSGRDGKLTACVRDFWQNYEKAIELKDSKLRIWLWPLEGQWPRRWNTYLVAQYAARMMAPMGCYGAYKMPGAVHKGHQIMLDFSGRSPRSTHAELDKPLFALASAEHYAATEAAPGLFAPPGMKTGEQECDQKLAAWMRMTRASADPKSEFSIWEARRRTGRGNFWYGWMDFGDIVQLGHGATSLAYDWPRTMLVNAMRTGDLNYLRLAEEMMQHRIDVDQHWSDREATAGRGLQRGQVSYSHFHCSRFTRGHPAVSYNWLGGTVLWHMMSGEPKARECAERNAAALVRNWARLAKSKGWSDSRAKADMHSNARAIFAFCSMYALTGQKKWLAQGMKLFNTNVIAKWKAHGPHLHDRKQIRSQDYTRDDIKYCYSIHAFCLLHHLTGDKKLFELLQAGCDTEFPENFFDAPLFLADLNAYVALKTDKRQYLDQAVEHWLSAFPESRCPPVYLPANSQWVRRAGVMLRTGHLLQYALWKQTQGSAARR